MGDNYPYMYNSNLYNSNLYNSNLYNSTLDAGTAANGRNNYLPVDFNSYIDAPNYPYLPQENPYNQ